MAFVHSDSIPNFITSATPMGLRRSMLFLNSKTGRQLKYFDIQFAEIGGKKVWVAWYYDKVDDTQIKELDSE